MLDSYKNKEGVSIPLVFSDKMQELIERAKGDIDVARAFYEENFYPLWREGYKMYHLSTADRQARIKKWQQNAALGLVRLFIDVFASSLTEKPIVFSVTGVNDKGIANAENIRKALAYNADISGFQEEIKEALKEGLKTGTFAADVKYRTSVKGKKYTRYDADGKPVDESFNGDSTVDHVKSEHMSVFSFYADPYNGNDPMYAVRRQILTKRQVEKYYRSMIDSEYNRSECKEVANFIDIEGNNSDADLEDKELIVDMIHRERAMQAMERDSYIDMKNKQSLLDNYKKLSGTRKGKGYIEVLDYETENEIIVFMNGYPVIVMDNMYGMIMKEFQSTSSAKRGADCEGVPYIVGDIARLYEGFGNGNMDNIRQVMDPTFVGMKGSILDEDGLPGIEPGEIIWFGGLEQANALRRLDKGGATDFGAAQFLFDLGTKLVGVSEYNMGTAVRERTAVGALSVSQVSSRRLSPFMQNFVSFISRLAMKWLMVQKQEWVEKKSIKVGDEMFEMLSNVDLEGQVIVSLQMDSMIAAINEFMSKKLIEVLNVVKGTGLVDEDEIMREYFRSMGLNPERFVPSTAPKVTTPPEEVPPVEGSEFIPTENEEAGQIIQQTVNPQVNLRQ